MSFFWSNWNNWNNWNNWSNWFNFNNVFPPTIDLAPTDNPNPALNDLPHDLTATVTGNSSPGFDGASNYWDRVNAITVQALGGTSGDEFQFDFTGTSLLRSGSAIVDTSTGIVIATLSGGFAVIQLTLFPTGSGQD